MAKPCLNVVNTNDSKMSNGMEEVSITKVQFFLIEDWIFKNGKVDKNGLGLVDASLCLQILKTPIKTQFTSKVIL